MFRLTIHEAFDETEWSASEVASELSSCDYCKVCLLDFNGEDVPCEEKVQRLCKLPLQKSPDGSVNRQALQAMASGRGIPGLEKPRAEGGT